MDEPELFLRPPGSPDGLWIAATGRPLRDRTGNITGGVLVLSDINSRKQLEREIAEAGDRERRRLGEDLHDGLCQHLVSTAFATRKLATRLGDRSPAEAADAVAIAELLSESIAQARNVARGLYIVPPEAGGLASALDELAAQARVRHAIHCEFHENNSSPALDEMVATNLFRIAQEAVANAAKHSGATQISITLSFEEHQLCLAVADNGCGIGSVSRGSPVETNARRTSGLGLRMMSHRARMIGASFDVAPGPSGGTLIRCTLRLPNSISAQTVPAHAGKG